MRISVKQSSIFNVLLLVATLLAVNPSHGALSCREVHNQSPVYRVLPEGFLTLKTQDFPVDRNFRVKEATVISEERVSTPQGELNVFERVGPTWSTMFAPDNMNYQGDPRWFPATVGPRVAAEFGFFMMTDKKILTPTADYANRAIQRLNGKLSPDVKILFRFRETGAEPFEGIAYLQDFLRRTLPIAENGHYAVHDLSYHFAAVLYPKEVLPHADARIRLILKLREWSDKLDNSYPHENALLRKVVEQEIHRKVMLVDSSSGSLGYVLAKEKVPNLKLELELVQQHVLGTLFRDGTTAVSEIQNNIIARILREPSLPEANRQKTIEMVGEFFATVKDPRYHVVADIQAEGFLAQVQKRIEALKALLAKD